MSTATDRLGCRYLLVHMNGPDGKLVKDRKISLFDEIDPNSMFATFDASSILH